MEHQYCLRPFIDRAVDAFFVHDLEGRILDLSTNALRCFGLSSKEALACRRITDLIVTPDAAEQQRLWREVCGNESGEPLAIECLCRRQDNSEFPVVATYGAVRNHEATAIMLILRDISAQKRSEALLDEHDDIFRAVFNASGDAILLLDGTTFIDCNEAAVRMLRCRSKEELFPAPPWGLSPERQPDGRLSSEKAEEMIRIAYEKHFHRFEWIHTRADGENFPVEVTLTPIELGGRQILHVVWNDITERKNREKQIETLARYDPLTGLPNRRLLQERGQQAIELAQRHGRQVGVLYMDLDRFKDINDTQGHDVGDALLIAVAERFHDCVRSTDTVARLGGDEFAFLLPETGKERALEVAERLVRIFDTPFQAAQITAQLGASIGVVSYPEDGATLSELLKNADIAMYEAKGRGIGFSVFRDEHAQRISKRVSLEQALRQAVENEELTLHYQPRVHTADGSIHSVEALARWEHRELGWISPGEFIPVAESSGVIHPMGINLFKAACRQLTEWSRHGIAVRVALNVSVLELQRGDFVAQVEEILRQFRLEGDRLEIEITESAAMTNPEINVETLAALKALGVHVAIDDFGTGYSSLNYLKRLPVDSLKVDRSFVRDMTFDPTDAGIIESIVTLAKSMSLQTVAEGVETPEQALALRRLGCDYLQGYLFTEPLAAAGIEPLLKRGLTTLPWSG
ncbi:MAG: EAL domain-containing protein [Gammaproteobacteria bacterium]